MPIRDPSHRPLPKSACTGAERPIDAMSCAESAATGSPSTRSFHGLVAGKTGQPASTGELGAAPDAVATRTAAATDAARAASLTVGAVAPASRVRLP